MFFRPNYCANCGEKVERTDWGPFTSRRFCPVCESEYKGQDLIPRVLVGFCLIVGIFGTGAYLKSGPAPPAPVLLRQPQKAAPPAAARQNQPPSGTTMPSSPAALALTAPENRPVKEQVLKAVPRFEETQESYICGAETKKGTPCSRRVKGNVRCYQHKGMPAMVPADKLKLG